MEVANCMYLYIYIYIYIYISYRSKVEQPCALYTSSGMTNSERKCVCGSKEFC